MKNALTGVLFALIFILAGCKMDGPLDNREPIVEPPFSTLVERDTISSGSYLGLAIQSEAAVVYSNLQSLRQSNGVLHVNIVSNISSDITQLGNRILLYDYILLDESKGTDSGVQITIESGKVKSIYLNSGKKLGQWPLQLINKTTIRLGDSTAELHEKLTTISKAKAYAQKFQRIMLLTKNLSSAFDPAMAQSPQWYFAHKTGPDSWETVQMHLKDGKLNYIAIDRYRD